MKTLLALSMLLAASPAFADAGDDYVQCVVGKAAVAIHKGKGTEAAQEWAYKQCARFDAKLSDNEGEALSDYVNLAIEGMATQVAGK